jgi:hypothetical protein
MIQYLLMVGPLAFYLWILAWWNSGRSPRVVPGLVDFGLLAFGLGGVLAFGPIGQLTARVLFGNPGTSDWLVILAGLGVLTSLLARKSLHRVVVYRVSPEDLRHALEASLAQTGGSFVRTLRGFEDRESGRGLNVEVTKWFRCALIEAHGRNPEGLIQEIRPRLRTRLRGSTSVPSALSLVLYGMSVAVMLAPLVTLFLTQPRARAALRVLLERLRGG